MIDVDYTAATVRPWKVTAIDMSNKDWVGQNQEPPTQAYGPSTLC